jgi:hypothetical protein
MCRVEDEAGCRDGEMFEMLRCAGLHWRRWQEMLGRLPDGFGLAFAGRCCWSSTLDLVFGALPGGLKKEQERSQDPSQKYTGVIRVELSLEKNRTRFF